MTDSARRAAGLPYRAEFISSARVQASDARAGAFGTKYARSSSSFQPPRLSYLGSDTIENGLRASVIVAPRRAYTQKQPAFLPKTDTIGRPDACLIVVWSRVGSSNKKTPAFLFGVTPIAGGKS
jgi:hypothetical protein